MSRWAQQVWGVPKVQDTPWGVWSCVPRPWGLGRDVGMLTLPRKNIRADTDEHPRKVRRRRRLGGSSAASPCPPRGLCPVSLGAVGLGRSTRGTFCLICNCRFKTSFLGQF